MTSAGLNLKYSSNVGGHVAEAACQSVTPSTAKLRHAGPICRRRICDHAAWMQRFTEAAAKAERIRLAVANRPFIVDGNEISMTACLSVAVSSGRSPLIVLREAERALSLAKQAGSQIPVHIAGEITSDRSRFAVAAAQSQHHSSECTRRITQSSRQCTPPPKAATCDRVRASDSGHTATPSQLGHSHSPDWYF